MLFGGDGDGPGFTAADPHLPLPLPLHLPLHPRRDGTHRSQARARLELREEVTVDDALDVVEIMRTSMIDTASDEFGLLDFDRSQHGSGISLFALP